MGQIHSGLQPSVRLVDVPFSTPPGRLHRRKTMPKAMKDRSPHHEPAPVCSSTLDPSDQKSSESVLVTFKTEPILIPSEHIQRLGNFPVGSGGLGDIWKCAMSTPAGTHFVAVKSFRVHSGDKEVLQQATRRIRREAYVWIHLSHNNILPFEGLIEGFGPLPALVCAWMGNGSLSDYLKQEYVELSDTRKSELIQHVAAGLSYLHNQNIVHGDLTGTNILVDDSGNLRLADFSLSMILAPEEIATFSSVAPGNSRWMAPEFVLLDLDDSEGEVIHAKPTKAGDIYSFGCVMLQILSGKEPYSRLKSAMQVISAIMREWGPFDGVEIDMNEAYRQLSSRCLSRDPNARPTTIEMIVGLAV